MGDTNEWLDKLKPIPIQNILTIPFKNFQSGRRLIFWVVRLTTENLVH